MNNAHASTVPASNGTLAAALRETVDVLERTPTTTLLSEGSIDLAAMKDRFGFPTALPERPPLPEPPQAPAIPPAPREDEPKYDVALSTMDRLISSRRIKKQQAALNRFERDRKAWGENRTNAMAHYEMAQKRHAREVEALDAAYASMIDAWKESFVAYLRATHL